LLNRRHSDNPRVDVKDTTLLLFHCPNNILLSGSNFKRDILLCDDFGRFRICGFHPVWLLLMILQARILYISCRRTYNDGTEYLLSM
jgi:hypothetical protein